MTWRPKNYAPPQAVTETESPPQIVLADEKPKPAAEIPLEKSNEEILLTLKEMQAAALECYQTYINSEYTNRTIMALAAGNLYVNCVRELRERQAKPKNLELI
ncbi:MAG: hypothetical protein PHE27_08510 [Alphaproteobacteria bacterium]|nr:hypothetical protein [Alphaproteobacteria bacterium]